jgi:glycosyltransferase involved in cell wall biosynthesis
LLHIPHNADDVLPKERFVVTMHDVFEYDMALKQNNQKTVKSWEQMALCSEGIVTCSEFSKQEIVNRFNVDPGKIDVIYWGIDTNMFHRLPAEKVKEGLARLGIDHPFFLSVSCSSPRKNVRTLLKAFRKFCENNVQHQLVLVWGNPPKELLDEYGKEIRSRQIVFLDFVSDEDLLVLYNGASITMFPTRAEGFGFPVLESFACGTPVMTCANTSLPEVGRDAALYVGEDHIDEMVDVMTCFEKSSYDVALFRKKAATIVNSFSWDNTAQKYIQFYGKYL